MQFLILPQHVIRELLGSTLHNSLQLTALYKDLSPEKTAAACKTSPHTLCEVVLSQFTKKEESLTTKLKTGGGV